VAKEVSLGSTLVPSLGGLLLLNVLHRSELIMSILSVVLNIFVSKSPIEVLTLEEEKVVDSAMQNVYRHGTHYI
jgi:hypothetical protein